MELKKKKKLLFTAVFCTGGRDGNIMVWDIRCSQKGTGAYSLSHGFLGIFITNNCSLIRLLQHFEPESESLPCMSCSQMVFTSRWSRSAALTTKPRQILRPKEKRDAAAYVAWLPVWWVSAAAGSSLRNSDEEVNFILCVVFYRTPSRV